MKNKQKKRFFSFLLAVFTASLFFGLSVNAAGTDSGYELLAPIPTVVDDAGNPITTNITLVDYMKGLFVAAIGLAIVLAVVQLVIGGIEYVAAAVPSAKEDAKRRIGGAVGGLLLILLSWVLLQALNPKLLSVGLNLEKIAVVGGGGGGGGGGGTICRFAMPANQKVGPTYPTQADCEADIPPGSGQVCKTCPTAGGVGGARCSPITAAGSPCSVANLTTAFGGDAAKATKASIVCHWESSGRPAVGGDVLPRGPNAGMAVSFGLFQINLSAPPGGAAIGGITNCPSAFSAPVTGAVLRGSKVVTITNMALYNQCKAAAQNPDNNIQTMIAGSNNGTNFGPWTGARKCGI